MQHWDRRINKQISRRWWDSLGITAEKHSKLKITHRGTNDLKQSLMKVLGYVNLKGMTSIAPLEYNAGKTFKVKKKLISFGQDQKS